MCGIAGYWGKGDEQVLDSMIDAISYRGPDDKGLFVKGNMGLAQRRLSIIDLTSAGHQPMSNEDKTVQIIFNGEIYNYKELKTSLKQKHTFKSSTDTEVILRLYEEYGEEVFSKIQGMFAIALFDSKNNKLFLARDRMGKKPLYWYKNDNVFLFGSELKALMKHPSFEKEIDLVSLNKYLTYEYVPTPHSIFKNTYKLEPGTYLTWDGKETLKKVFWEPKFLPKSDSFEQSLESLDKALEQSVEDRLVSDVPIGVFLSGGIDSSTVAYYASRAQKNKPEGKIKTFSIGFKETSFDESSYAKQVSKHLGTEHYEKILTSEDSLSLVPKIGEILDEPMADSSLIPTYLLSKFTKENVTVALGGDGGDELFLGYDTFLAHRLASLYEKVPRVIRTKIIQPLVKLLPTSFVNMSLDFKIKKFVEGFEGNKNYRNDRWLGAFSHIDRANLFKKEISEKLKSKNEFDDIDTYLSHLDSQDFFDQVTLLHQRMYMMDQVLVKVDRASMANSLEVRAPFLDTRVVDLANHMPTEFKLRGLERKYILKKLMGGKLPDNIVYRKKKGFGVPIAEWIRGDLKPVILDFLGRESIEKMGLFNYDYIEKILDEHFSGKKDNRKQIWTLFVFAMWHRKWLQ